MNLRGAARAACGLMAVAGALSCHDATAPSDVIPTPAFVTVRRAWAPGERDSVVARMRRDSLDGFFYPAAVAELLATSDSVTVLAANPALAAAAAAPSGLQRAPRLGQSGQTWIMVGLDLREVFPTSEGSSTLDSLNWVGVMWYASPESTWKGRVVAASVKSVWNKIDVNTAAFDSSGGTSGVGGGEARASTRQYWEANSGQFGMKTSACNPRSCADQTFTSGPFTGGLWHGLLMGGNLIQIAAPCVQPAGCTAPPDTFSVGFTGTPIDGLAITCIFPSPCTGRAAAAIARLAMTRSEGAGVERLRRLAGP